MNSDRDQQDPAPAKHPIPNETAVDAPSRFVNVDEDTAAWLDQVGQQVRGQRVARHLGGGLVELLDLDWFRSRRESEDGYLAHDAGELILCIEGTGYPLRRTRISAPDPLHRQIVDELTRRTLDPLDSLLGPGEEVRMLRQRIDAHARMWAANLRGDDDRLAADTVTALIVALWPDDGSIPRRNPPTPWWGTPLGQAAARTAGHPWAEVVSYSVAGAMLGIGKTGAADLLNRGKLDRHPDGGVLVASVRARILAQEQVR